MSHIEKIVPLQSLACSLAALKAEGRRIVLCHGVFDLLHIGHIRYLRQAREHGDVLVVTVTPDRFVDKGPHRPAFNEQLRAEALAALDCTDFVAINLWPTAEETLRQLKPDCYAKGAEFKNHEDVTGKIGREAAVTDELGIEMIFIEDILFSSSTLINRYLSTFSEECQEYLDVFRRRYSLGKVLGMLDSFAGLDVLVVGDTIVDEYVYCSGLGASSKDPVLALLYESQDAFAGGAAAVANHLAQHVRSVTLCTVLGDDGQEAFIRGALAHNVTLRCVIRPHAPTVRKTRFIDGYSFQKQLEVYHMERTPLPETHEATLAGLVEQGMGQAQLVVAADFGHGCITERQVAALCDSTPFLAVNTQANAGNRGYHTIGRYPHADFVSLASHEITLQYRNRSLSLADMMTDLAQTLHTRCLLVTEGRRGCAVFDNHDFVRAPSFTSRVIDRVGAGDALFAVAALAARKELPIDMIAFLGNIAGSLAVETIGNTKAVGREAMQRYITAVMK